MKGHIFIKDELFLLEGETLSDLYYKEFEEVGATEQLVYTEEDVEKFAEKVWNAAIEAVCEEYATSTEKDMIRKLKLPV